MAKTVPVIIKIGDPYGVLDAIATLEQVRDMADHRIEALRAMLRTASVDDTPYVGGRPDKPWHQYEPVGDGTCAACTALLSESRLTLGGTSGTKPPPPPPSDRG